MKRIKGIILVLSCASVLGLSSCGPDDTPEPKDYPINDFIFNTYLFADGTWWVFYDSTTNEYDTISVTYSFGQHQNVYEGDNFKYYRYYYRGDWYRSKTAKTYLLEYSSDHVFDHKGNNISRIDMRTEGKYFDVLYYDNAIINDTMTGGYYIKQGNQISSYNLLIEKGDSFFSQNLLKISPYVKYKILNSTTNDLQDITFIFQAGIGPVYHSISGNYQLIYSNVIPMIK